MAERLKKHLPDIIFKDQDAFVKGRKFSDGVITIHETLHIINRRKETTMILKLDMQKAYNEVNWKFLDSILAKFVFYPK